MIVCLLIPDWVTVVMGSEPIILISDRQRVQGASLIAVQAGVRYAMRVREAHALYPTARLVPIDEVVFSKQIDHLYSALEAFTHKIEVVGSFWQKKSIKRKETVHPSAAIFYMDIGKRSRPDALELAGEIHQTCQLHGNASAALGLGSGKFVAAVAARYVQPGQSRLIQRGREKSFLSSYPVSLLPLDKETGRRLNLLGIRSLGQLADLPAGAVLEQFGKPGKFLHELASGKDTRPVIPRTPKATEQVRIILDSSIEDRLQLESLLGGMGCEIEEKLKHKGYTTRSLTLELRLDDRSTAKAHRVLREPTQDGRLLGRTLLRLLAQLELAAGVIELRVTADELAPLQLRQLDLFTTSNPQDHNLTNLLDSLVTRFGPESLFQIVESQPDQWLSEYRFQWDEVA